MMSTETSAQVPQNVICTENGTLTWDPNIETDLAGYKIYASEQPGAPYAAISDVGFTATPSAPLVKLVDVGVIKEIQYFFVATAYDTTPNESGFSNEANCFFDQVVGDTTPPGNPQSLATGLSP